MQDIALRRTSTLFLQAFVILIGIGTLAFLLWEPHVEGVNANATTLADIYFDDPLLAYAYVGSIAFFVALYQAFRLLGYIERNKLFTREAVRGVRTIKYCGIVMIAFVAGAAIFLFIVERGKSDDIAGGVAMCVFALVISAAIAAGAAVLERRVRSVIGSA